MSVAGHVAQLPIGRVRVLPFAGVAMEDVRALVAALEERVEAVTVEPPAEMPPSVYDARRHQHRAEALLRLLEGVRGEHVLGLTAADLYAGGLNFVFGIADPRSRAAVVSLARLAVRVDRQTYLARAVKEVVHELGHTLGLAHCDDPACVMHFSNSLADTDAKSDRLCAVCQTRLERARGDVRR